MKFLLVFIALSIINVVFSTVRSIATIKGGKVLASLLSGGYFAFYNIMLIYTVADFPMWQKCVITFACNVVGVFIVKAIEDKMRKDKIWLVKMTIPTEKFEMAHNILKDNEIPHQYFELGKNFVIDCYCATKAETSVVMNVSKMLKGKTFATENSLI